MTAAPSHLVAEFAKSGCREVAVKSERSRIRSDRMKAKLVESKARRALDRIEKIRGVAEERQVPASDAPSKRRGFGDIVIRPLGPAIRSQTVIEDGIKVVVINSQHPLFRERKGEIWYQLETAASEICQSIDGVTLAEYERRVNEIVLLAFRLRGRRRKPRTPVAQLKVLDQGAD